MAKVKDYETCGEESLYIRRIPEQLKTDFKVFCVREGLAMNDLMTEVMREIIRNPTTITAAMRTNITNSRERRKRGE